MNILKTFTVPIEILAGFVDDIFVSEDEKLSSKDMKKRLENKIQVANLEINKEDAKKRSLFHSGWRPLIAWFAAINFIYMFALREWFVWFDLVFGLNLPELPMIKENMSMELMFTLLGMGGLRTIEKIKGKA